MDTELRKAAENGSVDVLYQLLSRRPRLLEKMDRAQIIETPVHVAAKSGKTHFALEVANLKPTLARKLNPDGLSPLHLALRNGHFETARGLVKMDSNLVRVKGKDGITPLHEVVLTGDAHLLEEFLLSCPSSIEDLTVRCETAVHTAVKNGKMRCFLFLYGWLHRVNREEMLDWKDEDGYTVLHTAVDKNVPRAVELLINSVDADAKKLKDLTALELFEEGRSSRNVEIGKILKRASLYSKALNSLVRYRDNYLGMNRMAKDQEITTYTSNIYNIITFGAGLIATATYQAVFNPPGGYGPDGKSTMTPTEISYFVLLNTAAFCASVCTIVVLMMGLPLAFLLEASTMFISCAYFVSLLKIFPPLDSPTIVLLLIGGTILASTHFIAFEVHRRQHVRREVGRSLPKLGRKEPGRLPVTQSVSTA